MPFELEFEDAFEGGAHAAGVGVHPFGDPSLRDEFERVTVPVDARGPHAYVVEWTPAGVDFLVDGERVKRSQQSPGYPMQLRLGLYAFPPAEGEAPGRHPKELLVDSVRGWPLGEGRCSEACWRAQSEGLVCDRRRRCGERRSPPAPARAR